MPLSLGVVLTTDTIQATKIWAMGVFDAEAPFAVAICPYNTRQQADAVDLIRSADRLIVPNEWTIKTLLRFYPDLPQHLVEDAIILQTRSRDVDEQHTGHRLADCAKRLGMARLPYKGGEWLTQRALDACKRDAEIVHRLHHYLETKMDAALGEEPLFLDGDC